MHVDTCGYLKHSVDKVDTYLLIIVDLTDDAYSDKKIFYFMKSLATYLTAHINVKIKRETIVKEIMGTLKSRRKIKNLFN